MKHDSDLERRVATRGPAGPQPAVRVALGGSLLMWTLSFAPTFAEERLTVAGLIDLEAWKTDAASELLSRNDGHTGLQARVRLWGAGELGSGVQAFVLGAAEGGRASTEESTSLEIEQAYLRYSFAPPARLLVEAGRIGLPIGSFPRRHLSSGNPLIGAPAGYEVNYASGLKVAGWAGPVDYTVAAIDLPITSGADVPHPGRALRPAVALGVTPTAGVRLGAYATQGPYLNPDLGPALGVGSSWKDYGQRVAGLDAQFSRGYFVLNGEFAWSRYEVPGGADPIRGRASYIEPVYTWSPRVFTAVRVERINEPYVEFSGTSWESETPLLFDVEVGVGLRLAPGTLLKIAYRRARWDVDEDLRPSFPNGHALSAQFSYAFDVNSWFRRPR